MGKNIENRQAILEEVNKNDFELTPSEFVME